MLVTNIIKENIDNVIEFKKLSYPSFRQQYEDDIRICIDFKKIIDAYVSIALVNDQDKLLLPWYKRGSWSDGEIVEKYKSNNLIIVRLPALLINRELGINNKPKKSTYLLMDGCHRMEELEPGIIILDILHLGKDDFKYIIDLYNKKFCTVKYNDIIVDTMRLA